MVANENWELLDQERPQEKKEGKADKSKKGKKKKKPSETQRLKNATLQKALRSKKSMKIESKSTGRTKRVATRNEDFAYETINIIWMAEGEGPGVIIDKLLVPAHVIARSSHTKNRRIIADQNLCSVK
jgi:hypothetical protein